jgi:hypothetical protein
MDCAQIRSLLLMAVAAISVLGIAQAQQVTVGACAANIPKDKETVTSEGDYGRPPPS